MLRHAIKANLIKSNTTLKCVFNNYSFKYEIHELKNNKIDWRNIVSEKDCSNWADSFSDYQKSFTYLTYLNVSDISALLLLNSKGYTLFRLDRNIHAGGVLILILVTHKKQE